MEGYFYHNSTRDCQVCSYCCNDGKDEKQQECINHGLRITHCAPRQDKHCGPTAANDASLIGISIFPVVIPVLVLGAYCVSCVVAISTRRRRIERRNPILITYEGDCALDAVYVPATNDSSQGKFLFV